MRENLIGIGYSPFQVAFGEDCQLPVVLVWQRPERSVDLNAGNRKVIGRVPCSRIPGTVNHNRECTE